VLVELFSHRKGFTPVKVRAQLDDMDQDLRVAIWNALDLIYWRGVHVRRDYFLATTDARMHASLSVLWAIYFKRPNDTMPTDWRSIHKEIRDYFFACEWYQVYDFIEFIACRWADDRDKELFIIECNAALERETSAYRFVGGRIAQITSHEEIAEVEEAAAASPSEASAFHIRRGLELLTDRKAPDYRNSVKESISAVEAASKVLTGDKKASLDGALAELKRRIGLHGALEQAFKKMYGFTSDAEGIRHALMDEPRLEFEDAKFMLVACSAFVNYLKAKSSRPAREP
jgi:AbiJ-like protein